MTQGRVLAHFNAGDAVVLPLLRHAGIAYIDTLLITAAMQP
jgi:beta-lactamase superfamily II metal-dependent hydrolase